MSGLDRLISRIQEDEEKVLNEILESAKREAEELEKTASKKLEKELDKINEKALREIELTKDRLKSSTQLKARNNKLFAKQEVINRVFNEVLLELKNMSDTEYIDYIKTHISSEKSKLIVTKEKIDLVKKEFNDFEISEDRFVESGFVEVIDDIENNYTFEAKIALIREEVEGQIAKILYVNE